MRPLATENVAKATGAAVNVQLVFWYQRPSERDGIVRIFDLFWLGTNQFFNQHFGDLFNLI